MNKNLKKRWIEALRSGKYKQGRIFLKTNDGKFCCLGVLCDIIKPDWSQDTGRYFWKGTMYGALSQKYLNAIHLDAETQHQLIKLNDSEANDFNDIADYIKENVKEDKG